MELLLEGKAVSENLKKDFEKRIEKLKQEKNIIPYIAVLGMQGDEASLTYIKRMWFWIKILI